MGKKVIRITESELIKLITEVINEKNSVHEGVITNLLKTVFRVGKAPAKEVSSEISRILSNIKSGNVNAQEISDMTKRMSNVSRETELLKANYIKKHGQVGYDKTLRTYLFGGMEQKDFISQLKNVKDPNIQIKQIIGGGADHRVFFSKVNPNVIFKAEIRPGEVDQWFKTFNAHPDVFPKTFKKVKVKGENGEMLTAVVLEKLNTQTFELFWKQSEGTLAQFEKVKNLAPSAQTSLESLAKKIKKNPSYQKQWNEYIEFYKKTYPQLSKRVDEFNTIVEKLYRITPNPDIRKFNFGYNKTGSLKSLDI